MNYEIKEIISRYPSLNIQHAISYHALTDPHQERHVEQIVKQQMAQQLAEYILEGNDGSTGTKKPPLDYITYDDHHARIYRQTTYFFTRDELLQLAQECYHKGFTKQDMHINFTSSIVK